MKLGMLYFASESGRVDKVHNVNFIYIKITQNARKLQDLYCHRKLDQVIQGAEILLT